MNYIFLRFNSFHLYSQGLLFTRWYLRRPTCLPQPVYWALVVQGAQDHEVTRICIYFYQCIFLVSLFVFFSVFFSLCWLYFSVYVSRSLNFIYQCIFLSSYILFILLFQRVSAPEVHVLSPERKWAVSYKWVVVEAQEGLPCTFWVIRQPPTSTI